jgi:hypothetical protein
VLSRHFAVNKVPLVHNEVAMITVNIHGALISRLVEQAAWGAFIIAAAIRWLK